MGFSYWSGLSLRSRCQLYAGSETVLNCMLPPSLVRGAKIERAKIHDVVSRLVQAMKGDADEALLNEVLSPDVELNCPISEVCSRPEGHTIVGLLIQMKPGWIALSQERDVAVNHFRQRQGGSRQSVDVG